MNGWTYPTKDSPRIRVRDLLQHVGGFVTDDPWGDRQQVLPQEAFTKLIAAGVPFSRVPQSSHDPPPPPPPPPAPPPPHPPAMPPPPHAPRPPPPAPPSPPAPHPPPPSPPPP